VVTQTSVSVIGSGESLPQLFITRGVSGGGAVQTDRFGTLGLSTSQSYDNAEASVGGVTVSLASGLTVLLGSLQVGATDPSELEQPVQTWLTSSGVAPAVQDDGAVQTSPLGYAGWCATASTLTGRHGLGCFYPTQGGSTFIWVWVPYGVPDTVAQALIDHYVPGP
jgi:hypothetical protein